ncbi:MAG: hypothetical protein FDZ70_05255 [Actinobacteria bacterium]|nr:MAG: hypothetical protein FDZ70_05255 [Actinomycetota bacterium]
MSSSRPVRTVITVIMDVLVVVAVLLCAGLIVRFFGVTAVTDWGKAVVKVTEAIDLPLGLADIQNNYGGVFDVEAAATVVALLVAEWLLSIARRQA